MPQPVQRVERGLAVPAQIRRRARAIDDQRIRNVVLGRIEHVRRRHRGARREAAPVKLGEERLEPVWMLVVDRDGLHVGSGEGRRIDSGSLTRIGARLVSRKQKRSDPDEVGARVAVEKNPAACERPEPQPVGRDNTYTCNNTWRGVGERHKSERNGGGKTVNGADV